MTEPDPRLSCERCGTADDRSTSNGANDGAISVGTVLPRALTATLISTASHVEAESGACATTESCATTRSAPITSLFLPAAAPFSSAFASWTAHRALLARHCRGAARLVAARGRPVAAVTVRGASDQSHHRRRLHRHRHP